MPGNLIDLWNNYIFGFLRSRQKLLSDDHFKVFRSIGLLAHISNTGIKKEKIKVVHEKVFGGNNNEIDTKLLDLKDFNLISLQKDGTYSVHDSHIEALENEKNKIKRHRLPIESEHIIKFLSAEEDLHHLLAFSLWLFYNKRHLDGITIVDHLLKIDPNNVGALYNTGAVLFTIGEYYEALEYYDEVLKRDPNNVDAFKVKGDLLSTIGRHDEALKYYNEVLKREPNNVDTLLKKGIILSMLGRDDETY